MFLLYVPEHRGDSACEIFYEYLKIAHIADREIRVNSYSTVCICVYTKKFLHDKRVRSRGVCSGGKKFFLHVLNILLYVREHRGDSACKILYEYLKIAHINLADRGIQVNETLTLLAGFLHFQI